MRAGRSPARGDQPQAQLRVQLGGPAAFQGLEGRNRTFSSPISNRPHKTDSPGVGQPYRPWLSKRRFHGA